MANVSGEVKLDGKPLASGKITFSTDGRSPLTLEVTDGKYSGVAMVGPNQIQISSKRPVALSGTKDQSGGRMAAMMQGKSSPPGEKLQEFGEEIIDASFNVKSKESRVVESGGANKFDFDCKSAKK